uniref:Prolactin-releasing peptide receptor-like n=1 Tax=Dermatophagoides pteronyssinus TaxID=6956 RepID=A0A6P6Y4Q1_DERPT|nr:prolactin-releasing peptide receptor-like [Dermatophagoides pteronyssinus]
MKHDNYNNDKQNQMNILFKTTVDSGKFDEIFPPDTSTSSLSINESSGQKSRKNTNINAKMNGFMIFDPKNFNLNDLTSQNDTSIVGLIDLDSDVLIFRNLTTSEMSLLLGLENQTFAYDGNGLGYNDEDDYDDNGDSGSGDFDDIDSFAILDFWPGQFILITLYSLTAFLSLSLNIITIIVWFYGERSQSTEIWHLLVNLSLADIGMAIFCIPFTYTNVMLQHWIFPHPLCPVVNFTQLCFVFVSVWTLTIISIDRYFAIVHPLYKLRYSKRSILAIIWLVGLAFSSTQLFVSRASPYMLSNHKLYECIEVWSEELHGQIYTVLVFVLTFLIPVLIISLAYSAIWYHMVNHVTPGNPDVVRDTHQLDVKNKVFKMLTMVVGLFIICWLPIHFFNLLLYFAPSIMNIETEIMYNVYYSSFFVSHFLSMVHSLINPVVYCFMSENFRHNLLSLFPRYSNRLKRFDSKSIDHVEMGIPITDTNPDNITNTTTIGGTIPTATMTTIINISSTNDKTIEMISIERNKTTKNDSSLE